jgi:hypothetical protein
VKVALGWALNFNADWEGFVADKVKLVLVFFKLRISGVTLIPPKHNINICLSI